MFVGRKRELAYLEERFERGKPELLILYGRRRVGKTELTKEFLRKKRGIYYLAEKLPENLQLKKLSEKVIEFFHEDIITKFSNWEMLFKYLASKHDRYILVIDEFPYLIEREPYIISAFQKGWDEYLSNSNVFLVLTGSSVSLMENSVLSYKSPLYGRRTGQLLLNQFPFNEIGAFFEKKYEFDDLLKIWGTLGGVPFYLEQFDSDLDYYGNVMEKIYNQNEVLFAEAEFLLNEELREPRNYFAILRAISLGKRKLGEII
ncbi:ATPase AAA, partial [Mesotoga sp. HF07.pep.5.2.highcov]